MNAPYVLPLAISLLAITPGHAERIHVNPAATGMNDGSTWANAFTDLPTAIASAFADDELWVAQGSYKPGSTRADSFSLPAGVAIYGGFAGGESTLAERDPQAHETILSGDIGMAGDDSDNCYHVIDAQSATGTSVLDGVTVRDGQADGSGFGDRGGGIYFGVFGIALLNDVTFTNNHAKLWGGALMIQSAGVEVQGCRFTDNTSDGSGAGIAAISGSDVTVTGCTFSGNITPLASGSGGALYIHLGGAATVTGCTFLANEARFGGAIACSNAMRIATSGFRGNCAEWGGAIYLNTTVDTQVYNSEFIGNSATNFGGAIAYQKGDTAFTNCTFEGNAAGFAAGATYIAETSPAFANTIMWNNSGGGVIDAEYSSVSGVITATPTYHHCLIQGLIPAGEDNWDGTTDFSDPMFLAPVNPAQAPTLVGDVALRNGSLVQNHGDNAVDLDGSGPGTETIADLATDVAGNPRILASTVDLGAHEGVVIVTFSNIFPGLDPNADDNGNGASNFDDYAQGIDPTVPPAEPYLPRCDAPFVFTYSERPGAEDVLRELQQAPDPGIWYPMFPEFEEYVEQQRVLVSPTREEVTILIQLPLSLDRLFFRLLLTQF